MINKILDLINKCKLIVFITISILLIVLSLFNMLIHSKELLVEEETLISKQAKLQEQFITDGYTVDNPNVILDPYNNSPLTALILFETEKEVPVKITIVGKDENSTYVQEFESNTIHYIPVLGLYADTNNEVILEVDGKSYTLHIQTQPLPYNAILPDYVYADKTKLDNELYYYTPSSDGPTCAYDINGDIRWYLTIQSAWRITKLDNGNMLLSTERLVNPPYYTTGLYEIDMLGKIHNEYTIDGGYHHDYCELDNGNLIVLTSNFESGTVEDVIVTIDRESGDVINTLDLKQLLNLEDGKSEGWIEYDWFHNNSIWYDKETDSLILSGRHQDAIISVNYTTQQLNWIIGDPTNWSEEYQKYFFTPIGDTEFEWQWSQHAAMVTPEGYIFVLDNGNNKSKNKDEYVLAEDSYTRGVMYDINTDNMTIKQVWEYGKDRGSEFYSPYISDVDYINKNHYIVHSGGIVYDENGNISNYPSMPNNNSTLVSDTVELLNDKIIFEMKLPTNNYRVEKMELYDNYKFNLNKANRYGEFKETKVTNSSFGFIYNSKAIDDTYESRSINITKEIDRLVVNGNFHKDDDVEILLSQKGTILEYNVIISDRPYTALCISIFTDNLNVNKYINNTGLSGSYNIYIKLNDTIYNTGKKVEFN